MDTLRAVQVGIAAAVVVGGGIEIGLALTSGSTGPPPPAASASRRDAGAPPRRPVTSSTSSPPSTTLPPSPSSTTPFPSTTTSTTSTTTTTPAPPSTTTSTTPPTSSRPGHRARSSGTAPRLDALEPAEGRPGATITVVGSGFLSPDGRIVALFGSEPAPTRCPGQDRCLVTVPPGRPGSTVMVRVRTATGSSTGLVFAYR